MIVFLVLLYNVFGKTDSTRLVPAAQPSGSTRPSSDPSMDLTNHSQFQTPQASKSIKVSIHLYILNHLITLSRYKSNIVFRLMAEVNGSYLKCYGRRKGTARVLPHRTMTYRNRQTLKWVYSYNCRNKIIIFFIAFGLFLIVSLLI